MPRRPDAELVRTSKFQELMFHIMHTRNESVVYFDTQIDLTHTFAFLDQCNKDRDQKEHLTLFHVYLAACVRTFALRPKMNRFVSGRRLWQRNQILIAFVVKKQKTESGEEVNAMIEFDPFDTLETIQKTVNQHLNEARHESNKNEKDIKFFGALPRWLIKFIFWFNRWMDEHNHPIYSITKTMPLFCSAFVGNLGSIGLESVYHHPFDLGTASIIVIIGKTYKAAVVDQETEAISVRKVMDMRVALDDRISEGSYTGPSVHILQNFIEHPEPLLTPPDLTPEQLDKLKLKKYKKK